ncbi:MAG: leucyl aminopeptidase [Chloroflexota bacterium]|nr:leucyl aminopeptidase [Chloroflexota bacterium]
MELSFQAGDPVDMVADALIVPVSATDDGPAAGDAFAMLDRRLDGELSRLAADARFTGQAAKVLTVPTLGRLPARRIILAGLGAPASATPESVTKAWGAAALAAREAGAAVVTALTPPSLPSVDPATALEAAAIGAQLALYQFTRYHGTARPAEQAPRAIARLTFAGAEEDAEAANAALRRAETIGRAVSLSRTMVDEPASVMTPVAVADQAFAIAAAGGLEIEILGPAELAALGANAIFAVGMGSTNEPRLIRLRYQPTDPAGDRRIGLVGKCITFDTGGYSIKTHEGMLSMKGDMTGGAAVLATMSALRDLAVPVAVEATICAAENMISGTAFRPSDVITAMNGVTIEIISTDAEGRLVLADGLVDTARRGATELIDVATLTGAAAVALGPGTTALFASDDTLAENLLAASERSGERFWRMPLIADLNEQIKGDVADLKNSGGRLGGAITAALFLRRFSEGLPWAHLDIAPSNLLATSGPAGPKGASGVAVRTLINYLQAAG